MVLPFPPAFRKLTSGSGSFLVSAYARGCEYVVDLHWIERSRRFQFSHAGGRLSSSRTVVSLRSWMLALSVRCAASSVTLQKRKAGVWDRLTEDKAKVANMNVWWDMKERVQKDLDDFHHGNYTARYLTTEGGNGQAASDGPSDGEKEKSEGIREEL
ncbi:hypothetical protein TGP89_357260 [Toxoplasma gondii p89]|uniref:Uncharacterized protein n=1 Tax=Toxoplasma gondii p89 TaxID=943119 RepID=A0A086JG44_TOXGO|nr:hypothetical protein TGP89_357260 [Toxoplasma gondii p89]